MIRKLYYLLTPTMRFFVRRIFYFPIDFYEKITGKRDDKTPPRGLIFIGSGDFKKQGNHLLQLLINKTDLKPNHRILDVGCGIGRLAIPLTSFLSKEGSYEGFDIVKKGIDWCDNKITKTNPNFKFLHVDLNNKLYNTKTDNKAESFVFPYKNNDFDRVVLTSVFTHMLPNDVNNYLNQISRVLRKDGKCFATFFLFNEKVKQQMEEGKSKFNFSYDFGSYRLLDKEVEEANIAFDENYLLNLLQKNGLKAESTIYGWWSGRDKNELSDFQDIIVITKIE